MLSDDSDTVEVPIGKLAFWQSVTAHAAARATNCEEDTGDAIYRANEQMMTTLQDKGHKNSPYQQIRLKGELWQITDRDTTPTGNVEYHAVSLDSGKHATLMQRRDSWWVRIHDELDIESIDDLLCEDKTLDV